MYVNGHDDRLKFKPKHVVVILHLTSIGVVLDWHAGLLFSHIFSLISMCFLSHLPQRSYGSKRPNCPPDHAYIWAKGTHLNLWVVSPKHPQIQIFNTYIYSVLPSGVSRRTMGALSRTPPLCAQPTWQRYATGITENKIICLRKKATYHTWDSGNKSPTSFAKQMILNIPIISHQQRIIYINQSAWKLQQYKCLKSVKGSIKRLKYFN